MERQNKKVRLLEGWEGGREKWRWGLCLPGKSQHHMAHVEQFLPERRFGKGHVLWDLLFFTWGPESKVASVHCPDIGGTGHIPGVCGNLFCRAGGLWRLAHGDTTHLSACSLWGFLTSFQLNALLSKKGYKHSAFAKNGILSSIVVVKAGALDWSGLSNSAMRPRGWLSERGGQSTAAVGSVLRCYPSFGVGHSREGASEGNYPAMAGCSGGGKLFNFARTQILSLNADLFWLSHLGQIIFCVWSSRKGVRYVFSCVLLEHQTQWDWDPVVLCTVLYQVFYEKNDDSPTSGSLKSESYI